MTEQLSPAKKLKALIETGETILVPGAHDPLMGRILERMG
ncbi:MAG TPA: 2-methylisocitrate lyase, partial [Rhodospirillaceae bacterium]|nr:2-methylisocitrate lyase [Rhodospirillaceae bacterium]